MAQEFGQAMAGMGQWATFSWLPQLLSADSLNELEVCEDFTFNSYPHLASLMRIVWPLSQDKVVVSR